MRKGQAVIVLIPQKMRKGSALASCKDMGNNIFKIKFDIVQEEDTVYAVYHEITHMLADYLGIEEDLAHKIGEYAERVLKGGKVCEVCGS